MLCYNKFTLFKYHYLLTFTKILLLFKLNLTKTENLSSRKKEYHFKNSLFTSTDGLESIILEYKKCKQL